MSGQRGHSETPWSALQSGIRPAINNKNNKGRSPNMTKKKKLTTNKVFPAMVVSVQRPGKPRIATVKDGIRVVNREIISQVDRTFVAGVAAFNVSARRLGFTNTADIGAGFFGNTTWWGRMAGLYDRFKIHRIRLEFEPTLAFTHSGQVALYVDADFDPTVPATYLQMSGNEKVVAKQICSELSRTYGASHFNRLPWYDTSQGQSPTGVAGTVILATSQIISPVAGFAGTLTCGYLWMEYDVEFSCPSNPATASSPVAPQAAALLSETVGVSPTKILGQLADSVLSYKEEIAQEMKDLPELKGVGVPLLAALTAYAAAMSPKSRRLRTDTTRSAESDESIALEGGGSTSIPE